MPPRGRNTKKRNAETPAPLESSKKQRTGGERAPVTPKKAGPVLDLGSKLPKPERYVHPYVLSLFEEVKVVPHASPLTIRTFKTFASRLLFFGLRTSHTNVVSLPKGVILCSISSHLKWITHNLNGRKTRSFCKKFGTPNMSFF